MVVTRAPVVLALHLKRFKFDERTGRMAKLSYRVVYPRVLRLLNGVAHVREVVYDLVSVVVHVGAGPDHGHYISIAQRGGEWFVFDDEWVGMVGVEELEEFYGQP